MNKLRILPLAFLLWPAFASADCLSSQVCLVTSGTAVVDPNTNATCGFGPCAFFNFAGRNFSASGVIPTQDLDPACCPFDPDLFIPGGSFPLDILGGIDKLTVNGVPWGDNPGDAFAHFSANLDLSLASSGVSPFSFVGGFTGAPGLGCSALNCVDLEFHGSGIVTYGVSEDGVAVGPITFRFAGVPEPTTLSLFALGLVGLAMRRKAVAALRTS